jgi:hypothetical protein
MKENKRFTYSVPFDGFCDVYDNGKLLSCMRLEYVENTVNRLNELNNENKQLKQQLAIIDRLIDKKIQEFKNGNYGDLPYTAIHMFLDLKQEIGDV